LLFVQILFKFTSRLHFKSFTNSETSLSLAMLSLRNARHSWLIFVADDTFRTPFSVSAARREDHACLSARSGDLLKTAVRLPNVHFGNNTQKAGILPLLIRRLLILLCSSAQFQVRLVDGTGGRSAQNT
jgi:hypothetical protein